MTQSYHQLTNIYTAIARNNKIPYLVGYLWHFVRSLDVCGNGTAVIDLPTLARTCNRSVSTIKTNLRFARRLGLLRIATLTGLTARVSYTSITKVCLLFGIKRLGAVYEIYPEQLDQMRILNTRCTIANKQAQSIHMANKAAKEQQKPKVVLPSEIFEGASVDWRGVTVFKGRERDLLLADARFTVYGASQSSIGETLQRSRHTISRHLKAINGFEEVDRYQVLKLSEDDIHSSDFWDKHPVDQYNYCTVQGLLYRRCCNIYNLDKSNLLPKTADRVRLLDILGEIDIIWYKGSRKKQKSRDSINK